MFDDTKVSEFAFSCPAMRDKHHYIFLGIRGKQLTYFADAIPSLLPYPSLMFNPFNAEATFVLLKHKDAKFVESHLNPVLLVFIGKLSLSTLR